MARRILITGGAGFLGSHLADHLLARGYEVRALDALVTQVHGRGGHWPEELDPAVELEIGDIRDPGVVGRAMQGVDAIVHFAAAVGVGQSMYQSTSFTDVNCRGTAIVMEQAVRHHVGKVVVGSSVSVYGEGAYVDARGQPRTCRGRSASRLLCGHWELTDDDGAPLQSVPTPEDKPTAPASVYALTKLYQEQLCFNMAAAYRIPTVVLRFCNAYGPRQRLAHSQTGVLAIFASRVLRGQPPLVYEDGRQRRDFVSAHDVARACVMALETDAADGQVLNIGSGESRTILGVAEVIARALGRPHLQPKLLHKHRMGDIRHCYADIGRAARLLGWRPLVRFETGITEFATWLQRRPREELASPEVELQHRGLAT